MGADGLPLLMILKTISAARCSGMSCMVSQCDSLVSHSERVHSSTSVGTGRTAGVHRGACGGCVARRTAPAAPLSVWLQPGPAAAAPCRPPPSRAPAVRGGGGELRVPLIRPGARPHNRASAAASCGAPRISRRPGPTRACLCTQGGSKKRTGNMRTCTHMPTNPERERSHARALSVSPPRYADLFVVHVHAGRHWDSPGLGPL